jgi:hypothetical protein
MFAFVLQRLCFSFCVPASVLHTQSIAINDNLDHLRHLCCSHISNNYVSLTGSTGGGLNMSEYCNQYCVPEVERKKGKVAI